MVWLLLLPFALHAAALLTDEFYFHHERGLPRWERIGHPLDTFTVLAGFYWILFLPWSGAALKIYLALAIFSCLFVTKDEWVHVRCCRGGENWLHAILFLLHPVTFIMAALIWPFLHGQASPWLVLGEGDRFILQVAFPAFVGLTTLYWIYQILYWNWLRKAPNPLAEGMNEKRTRH